MRGKHEYRVRAEWKGNLGTGTTGYRDYARDVLLSAPGKPPIEASADAPFRGNRNRWNPEDMLVAALSECHLLSYLHACVTSGVVVLGYSDDASGIMTQSGNGGRFSEVILRPHVTVRDASMLEAAREAHTLAHEWCFIASSVNFPVRIDAQISALNGARGESRA